MFQLTWSVWEGDTLDPGVLHVLTVVVARAATAAVEDGRLVALTPEVVQEDGHLGGSGVRAGLRLQGPGRPTGEHGQSVVV